MASALEAFLEAQDWALLERVNGWSLIRDSETPDIIRISISASDGQRYIVRCQCDGYPEEPPSVVFVSEAGSKSDPTAWPAGDAEFDNIVKPPANCFLCTSLTREGLQHHNEWRNDASKNPWNGKKHTLMDIFNLINRLLNGPHYTRRKTP